MQKNIFYTNLHSLGLIQITGPDAEKFLQGQLTCDVREATAGQILLGAHCDHKGRIQATFRLFNDAANYYLQLPRGVVPHLLNTLQKYAIFSKVTLQDVSDQWQQTGICGEDAVNTLIKKDKHDVFILPAPGSTPHFYVLSSINSPATFTSALPERNESSWNLMDINAGIPTIFPETIGLFTSQQINFPAIGGVNFKKGCYTGQEIVARMHYLGKTKQRMYRVLFNTMQVPSPGTGLWINGQNGPQETGTIVQAAAENADNILALAVIYDNALSQDIHVGELAGPILNIMDLPYTV